MERSRNHRAFCGFSMDSVTTWHTFEYCLPYFRYFLPSSGDLASDGIFIDADNEQDDNLVYRVREGNEHNGEAAMGIFDDSAAIISLQTIAIVVSIF